MISVGSLYFYLAQTPDSHFLILGSFTHRQFVGVPSLGSMDLLSGLRSGSLLAILWLLLLLFSLNLVFVQGLQL